MNKIFIAFMIFFAATACSKKENEPEPSRELVTFSFDSTAPFAIPIIDWTKDSKYIKTNPPEGYNLSSSKQDSNNVKVGQTLFLFEQEIKFISVNTSNYYMSYYFGKDNKLIGVVLCKEERFYSPSVDYFNTKIGKTVINNSYGKLWEARNVTISMSPIAPIYTYIALIKPSEVKLNQKKE